MRLTRATALGLLTICLLSPAPARAQLNTCYPGGSLLPNYTLNGAVLSGTDILVTPDATNQLASVFFNPTFDPSKNIWVKMVFRITTTVGTGADGMAFVMQNDARGAAAIGYAGEGIGYGYHNGTPVAPGGETPISPSVVIEFDTWYNANRGDPADTNDIKYGHVGLTLNGDPNHADFPASYLKDLAGTGYQLKSNAPMYTWLDYTAASHTLEVYINNVNSKPATPTFNTAAINLATQLGSKFYMGFSGSTGGSQSKHEVLEFYASDSNPVPESACCNQNSDCASSPLGPVCDANKHVCGQCTSTDLSHCTEVPPGCDLSGTSNVCMQDCLNNWNSGLPQSCPSKFFPFCRLTNPGAGTCDVCSGDNGTAPAATACAATTPYCSLAGYCGYCTSNADCTASGPTHTGAVCNVASGQCVQCTSTFDCPAVTPFCSATHTCLACNGDFGSGNSQACQDPAMPACNAGACVQCTSGNQTACYTSGVCNSATNTCTACDGDRGGGTAHACTNATEPICLTSGAGAGSCVQCTTAKQAACTGTTPGCNGGTNTCMACNGDFGNPTATRACTAAALPACLASGACVQCDATNSTACSGTTPECNAGTNLCTGCTGDFASTGNAYPCLLSNRPVCSGGACLQCTPAKPAACTGATPVCDATSDTCVTCNGAFGSGATDACATATSPICLATGACAACDGDTGTGTTNQCGAASPTCFTTGACAACTQNPDCTTSGPAHSGATCDTGSGRCVGCVLDSDCPAGDWCEAETCVPKLANGQFLGVSCALFGARACLSGVCEASDNRCGYLNAPASSGLCSGDASKCRGAKCDPDGLCGLANGHGACAEASQATDCRSQVCDASTDLCGLSDGATCAADGDCSTLHCADGACCNAACKGQCEACNLTGLVGTCSPVTGAPVQPRPACTNPGTTCGGACSPADRAFCGYAGMGIACGSPTCANGVASGVGSCDGSGACVPDSSLPCSPFVCGLTSCLTACAVDGECASDFYCSPPSCLPQLDLGKKCTGDDQCLSGHCADGYCCTNACGGQCEACDVAGSEGACTAVVGAPHGGRAACASDGSVCQGACDGKQALGCAYPDSAVECRAASCSTDVATLAAGCDSAGSCPPSVTQACAPYHCSGTVCAGDCLVDSDCPAGDRCSSGICVPKAKTGDPCASSAECASGFCADGVCCDRACGGQCEACDLAALAGTCSPITGAPHGGRASCASDGSLCAGTCDGALASSCSYPGTTTSCRAASCTNGIATLAASCDGAGDCPVVQTVPCAPFTCSGTTCGGGTCALDTDCPAGDFCASGQCQPQRPPGSPCAAADQCQNGFCVDGYCCDQACAGECEACDVAGKLGACSPVLGPPHGARPVCASDGTLCGGACDGTARAACAYPDGTTACRMMSCTGSVLTSAGSCDGAGHCPAASLQSCAPFACAGSACGTGCATDADCAAGSYCNSGICIARDPIGDPCTDAQQCLTGFCVDGLCCDAACTGGCAACDLPGRQGTCSAVAQGSAGTPSCSPYVCDGAGQACPTSCTDDVGCIAADYCAAGVCVPRGGPGTVCSATNQCLSGLPCVDGFCCDSPCAGQCQACNVTGLLGTCSPVNGAPNSPRPPCAGTAPCGGSCNGLLTATCSYPDGTVSCGSATCSAGVETDPAQCDGHGACAGATTACAPYVCGPTTCLTACTSDGECQDGYWCDAPTCKPQGDLGTACTAHDQCLSSHCADGVCCNSDCAGQCEACDGASAGTCVAITGTPHGSRPDCAGAAPCKGACDGKQALGCAYPGDAVQCRAPSCAADVATLAASCDGEGSCPPLETQACAPFHCAGDECVGNCLVDADCPAGDWCAAGVCVPVKGPGDTCDSASECPAGHCVDGVCCDAACTGECEACDVAGKAGTCTPVAGAPHGARVACASDGSLCGGACDGTVRTACAYPGASTECRAADCSADIATLAADCDGAGSCPAPQTEPCAPYQCSGKACGGECTVDGDCPAGDYCAAGVCEQKLPPGKLCLGTSECVSAHCVDGVCCDVACTGQCEACDVAGQAGTCSAVSGPPHGARPVCASDGSGCGGVCDGTVRTACGYPGSDTTCRAPACSDRLATAGSQCDGAGSCPAPQVTSCAPYACEGAVCGGGCQIDGDCVSGYICLSGKCQTKRPPGQACSGPTQCASALCVDGFCCDGACAGQCEACDVAGQVGTCSKVTGAPHGGRTPCTGTGACTGSCDGTAAGSCAFPGASTTCSPATCADGVSVAASTCDGNGGCTAGAHGACGAYACGPDGCLSTCQAPSDCSSGNLCINAACVPQGKDNKGNAVSLAGGCGCAQGSGSAWLVVAALALAGLRVRRRRDPR